MRGKDDRPWEARLFRLWLRAIPTRFGAGLEEDIVVLFENRLRECGRHRYARMSLLLISMVDAVWHGLGTWNDRRREPRATKRSVRSNRVPGLESVWHDIRFAVRTLRKRPLFTALAVGAMGLGIGGTTAMFSIVDGVLLKDLPYHDPEQLVTIWMANPSWRGQENLDRFWDAIEVRPVDYLSFRDHAKTLSSVAAFQEAFDDGEGVLTGEGVPEALSVYQASANLFETIGVQPILGRTFLTEEVAPEGDAARVAVLSFEIWKRRFDGRRDVLGHTVLLNDIPYQIVGVLPKGFRLPSDPYNNSPNAGAIDDGLREIWIPLGEGCGLDCGGHYLELVARLAPGVSPDQARAEVQALITEGAIEGLVARLVPTKQIITNGFGSPLSILLGAAAVLMLIACTNVAGLLVGEAARRGRELMVRSALGACRARLVRLLLTESLLLGLMGAGLGIVVAWLCTDPLLAIAPAMPRVEEIGIDVRVLIFATAVGMCTGLLLGVVPALLQTNDTVGPTLRLHSRAGSTRSLQSAVVSAQVALTVVLLVAAGLFVRSFTRIMSVDPGFDPEELATLTLPAPPVTRISPQQRALFFHEVLDVAREVPGVDAVSCATTLPFPGDGTYHSFGTLRNGEQVVTNEWFVAADPTYVETMRIPLLRGRLLSEGDSREAPGAMLVSQSLAQRHWPNESPLGLRARANGMDWTVVGVVGDIRQEALGTEVQPAFYVPIAQTNTSLREVTLVVRLSSDPSVVLPKVRDAIWSLYPDVYIAEPNTMVGVMRDSEADDRFRALLMWTFAVIAGVLAAVGIFGVTARGASARAHEMGIRLALGADGPGLILLVLKEGLLSAIIGLVLGLTAAFWASGLIAHLLFEIEARDPWTFAGATILSVTVCAIAAYIPARRVTKIDPIEVLVEP
ncbi:MAG: ABC transporter permease [Gemmatimonadota bacterium]|nr:MAG: ABC transporter permease [Gemmatimonadota bacterium]